MVYGEREKRKFLHEVEAPVMDSNSKPNHLNDVFFVLSPHLSSAHLPPSFFLLFL